MHILSESLLITGVVVFVVLEHYVEVDYVRAKVVGSGVCVQNGIVHKVDHILGIPGRNIYEEILANRNLR